MTTLDNTILIVALPSLARQLHASAGALQWSVDSYIVCRAALLFVAAALADRFGRRSAMVLGMIVFTAGSLACGLSSSTTELIIFRVAQSVGGAFMTPASMGIIVTTFKETAARAQALGVWSATTGLSTTTAPLLGGALVESFGWRSVFFVNVPVGIVALLNARRLDGPRPPDGGRRISVAGQASIGVGVTGLVYGLIEAPDAGWQSPQVAAALGIALLAGVIFVQLERSSTHPLITLSEASGRAVTGAVCVAIIAYLAMNGFLFYNTLYLQQFRGISPFDAGLLVTPVMIATIVMAPLSGRLTGRRGSRLPAVISCTLVALGLGVLAAVIGVGTPLAELVAGYVVLGVGIGMVNPPLVTAAVSSMPPTAAGVAAATTATSRQVGTSIGIALMGTVIYGLAPQAAPDSRVSAYAAAGFASALRYAYGMAGLLAAVAIGIAWWAFRPRVRKG